MFPLETKILFVDDVLAIRKWGRKTLGSLGYKNIIEASNGEEALAKLEKEYNSESQIKLVLADWNMPELDGVGLIKEMQKNEKFKDIPIIMISGEKNTSKILHALNAGVTEYIPKPFGVDVLKKKLQYVWESLHKDK